MPIIWDKKYSVGLEEIDEQHKVLIHLINNLENLHENHDQFKDFDGMVKKVLTELKNYTVLHFSTEEVLMRMFTYEDYDAHKQAHDNFIHLVKEQQSLILDLMTQRDNKPESLKEKYNHEIHLRLEKVLEFLQRWLLAHIMKSDFEYVDFFTKLQKKAAKSGGWLGFLKS